MNNKKFLIFAGLAIVALSLTNSNNANAQPSNDNNQPPTYTPPPLTETQKAAYEQFLQKGLGLGLNQSDAHVLAYAAAYDQRLPLKYRRQAWEQIFNQIQA